MTSKRKTVLPDIIGEHPPLIEEGHTLPGLVMRFERLKRRDSFTVATLNDYKILLRDASGMHRLFDDLVRDIQIEVETCLLLSDSLG